MACELHSYMTAWSLIWPCTVDVLLKLLVVNQSIMLVYSTSMTSLQVCQTASHVCIYTGLIWSWQFHELVFVFVYMMKTKVLRIALLKHIQDSFTLFYYKCHLCSKFIIFSWSCPSLLHLKKDKIHSCQLLLINIIVFNQNLLPSVNFLPSEI